MADSVNVFPAGMRLTDNDTGAPLEGAVIYFYEAGTSNPKTVYSSSDLSPSSAIGTSVVTNALGYPTASGAQTLVYVGTDPYKLEIRTAPDEYGNLGVLLASHDNIKGAAQSLDLTNLTVNAFFLVVEKTFNYTIQSTDQNRTILAVDCTLTLPSAQTVGNGWLITIQNKANINASSSVVVQTSTAGQTIINGAISYNTSITLDTSGQEITLISDGSNWRIKNPIITSIIKPRIVTKSSSYPVVSDDYNKIVNVNCSAATVNAPVIMTLPSASSVFKGWSVTFQHVGTGVIGFNVGTAQTNTNSFTIQTVGNQTITYADRNLGTSVSLFMNGDEITLTSDGFNWYANTVLRKLTFLTPQTILSTAPQTNVDYVGIPYWAKRVTVLCKGLTKSLTTTGTPAPNVSNNDFLFQLGVGTTPTTSGYLNNPIKLIAGASAVEMNFTAYTSGTSYTLPAAGFGIYGGNGGATYAVYWSGTLTLLNLTGNTWVANGQFGTTTFQSLVGSPVPVAGNDIISWTSGHVDLSGSLGMIRLTTDNGATSALTGGTINVMYE